ncbi:DoxX family protein [Microbacterium sp.]|uniref:DoxX family protein n=1 Tax=Microbacterium sp. TaxID=51671 RepID=UPI003A8C3316
MLIAYWIVAGLLALVFLAAGFMKIARSRTQLAASGMAWVDDFSDGPVKLIGTAEVIGAIGLILPALLGIAPIFSPIAAAALAVLMIGAVVVHIRRKESFAPALVLAVLSAAAAVLGFLTVV